MLNQKANLVYSVVFLMISTFFLSGCGGGIAKQPDAYNFILYQKVASSIKKLNDKNKKNISLTLFKDPRGTKDLGVAHNDFFGTKGKVALDHMPAEWLAYRFKEELVARGYRVEIINKEADQSGSLPMIDGAINMFDAELACSRFSCAFAMTTNLEISYIDEDGEVIEKTIQRSIKNDIYTFDWNVEMQQQLDALIIDIVQGVLNDLNV